MNDMYSRIRIVYKASDFKDTMSFHKEARDHLLDEGTPANKGFVGKSRKSEMEFRPLYDVFCYHNTTATLSEVRHRGEICPSLEFIAKEGWQNSPMRAVNHFIEAMDKKKGKYYIKRIN